jgi:hypothetical protein
MICYNMCMDKFLYTFALSEAQRQLVNRYLSPAGESSTVKGVPLDRLAEVKRLVRLCSPGKIINVKYRGPRHDWIRSTCLKQDAKSAAIYVY